MIIDRIEVARLAIPLRSKFAHSLASRSTGASILVRAFDREARCGHGESAPRSYVTGESVEGAQRLLVEGLGRPLVGRELASFGEVVEVLDALTARQERGALAATCALELAVLDLAGRHFDVSAGSVAGPRVRDEVVYSGVVSAGTPEEARAACERLRAFEVDAVKVKVGRGEAEDLLLLDAVREELGDGVQLRVDANCAWDGPTAVRRLASMSRFRLVAVEQPCPPEDLGGTARVRRETGLPVVLDEGCATQGDLEAALEAEAVDVVNLRVSKCGGLLRSARLRDRAEEAGLACMLGAQVGETAILSAAGRQLATRTRRLRFAEGSYGKLILEADVADALDLRRGAVGPALDGVGLGADFDLSRVRAFLSHSLEVQA